MNLPTRVPQTTALLAWLDSQLQFPIGKGKAPTDPHGWQGTPGQSPFIGYAVLHSITGGFIDGDLERPMDDGELIWQVNAIGGDQDQADLIADRIFEALCDELPPLAIAGRAVTYVDVDVPHGAAREDPDQPSTWFSPARYRIATTPT